MKESKKSIKGNLLILLGIMGILFYTILAFNDVNTGAGGFFIMLISIILIIEGFRIKKGKKFGLFDPPKWG